MRIWAAVKASSSPGSLLHRGEGPRGPFSCWKSASSMKRRAAFGRRWSIQECSSSAVITLLSKRLLCSKDAWVSKRCGRSMGTYGPD
jgi:hypothetical protein